MTAVDRPDNGQDEAIPQLDDCTCDAFALSAERHRATCPIGRSWVVRAALAAGRAGAGEQQRERLIEVMNRHGVPAVGNRAFFAELLALLGGPQPDGDVRQHRMDADCPCQPVQADNGAWDHQ